MKRMHYTWEERKESFTSREKKKKKKRKLSGEAENIGRSETSIRIRGQREQERSNKPTYTMVCNIYSPLFKEGFYRKWAILQWRFVFHIQLWPQLSDFPRCWTSQQYGKVSAAQLFLTNTARNDFPIHPLCHQLLLKSSLANKWLLRPNDAPENQCLLNSLPCSPVPPSPTGLLLFRAFSRWQIPPISTHLTIDMIYAEVFFLIHNFLTVLLPVMKVSSLHFWLSQMGRFLFCGVLCALSSLQTSSRVSHWNCTSPARCFLKRRKVLSSSAIHLVILYNWFSTFIIIG